MSTSYVYTKRFIDKEVRTLGKPLELTDDIQAILSSDLNSDDLSPLQVKKILTRVNTKIRRHNAHIFSLQVTNNIIQQVLTLESDRLAQVSDQLLKVNSILAPLLVPDFHELQHIDHRHRVKQLGELVAELPESKLLIVEPDLAISNSDVIRMVLENASKEADLLQKYTTIKSSLIAAHKKLEYNLNKLDYLRLLSGELRSAFGSVESRDDSDIEDETGILDVQNNILSSSANPLTEEINKFRVLVEKVEFSSRGRDLRAVVHELNESENPN